MIDTQAKDTTDRQRTAYERVEAEFRCLHPDRALTRMIASNGAVHFRIQCKTCGVIVSTPRKVDLTAQQMDSAMPFDDAIGERWRERWQARFDELRYEERDREKREWDAWYQEYLQSPGWHRKRAAVLKRARGTCEGCLTRPAVEVHHLTYEHVGDELLFELVAVCEECHAKIHEAKRQGVAS